MANSYEDFRAALVFRESSGNYALVNTLGFLGAYQFGEAALIDLGFVNPDGNDYDNNFSGGFTGKFGIDSVAEFLGTPAAQDAAADEWFGIVWSYATALGLDQYLGQTVGGVYITASSIIAGAHLLGAGAVQTWLDSGGTAPLYDAYGTPLAEYLALFTGYEMPFDTGETPGDLIPGPGDGLVLVGDASNEVMTGSDGDDVLSGAGGSDRLNGGGGNDALDGGAQSDVLIGGAGNDVLQGGSGFDLLFAGGGGDVLSGGAGTDLLFGVADRNEMSGDDGNDFLIGGAGTDLFIFADDGGDDRVIGFDASPTGDVVDLSDVTAITDYADLVQYHMIQLGENVFIDDFAGTTVTLVGMTLGELEQGDFLF